MIQLLRLQDWYDATDFLAHNTPKKSEEMNSPTNNDICWACDFIT